MNTQVLNDMIEKGYVVKKKHAQANLWLYNYTSAAQYERVWNDVTIQCRGIILNEGGEIMARPFKKFFNLSEVGIQNLPSLPFEVYEKMDGSLGVLYWLNGEPVIATRGSFNSDQAVVANNLLNSKYKHSIANLDPNNTYVFEIIYPENRIVVNYGIEEKLVLIGVVNTKTGVEEELEDIGFPLPIKYTEFEKIEDILNINWSNHEGFVLRFQNGFRVKVKFEEYVDLHRIITQISSYTIWEQLSTGNSLIEYIELIPDEFYDWVKKVETELITKFKKIESIALRDYKVLETEKETAFYFKSCEYPHILFAKWKNKNYEHLIWRLIKPPFEKAFTNKELK